MENEDQPQIPDTEPTEMTPADVAAIIEVMSATNVRISREITGQNELVIAMDEAGKQQLGLVRNLTEMFALHEKRIATLEAEVAALKAVVFPGTVN